MVGLGVIAVPVPLSATFNVGFTGSLLTIARVVVRAPAAVGRNVTLITQLPVVAGRLAPHGLDSPKSPAFPPVRVMLVMFKTAVPVLVSVTVFAALVVFTGWSGGENASEVGATPALGAVPVPVSGTFSVGFVGSLLRIVTEAVRDPPAVGLKVTLMVQIPEVAARVPGQPFVWA